MDEKDRVKLEIRLVLAVWRREIRRLAEERRPAEERAAFEKELRNRARHVLATASEKIRAAGDDSSDRDELAKARQEIDADG